MLRSVNLYYERSPEGSIGEKIDSPSRGAVIAKRSGQSIQRGLWDEPSGSPCTEISGNPGVDELAFVAGFQPNHIVTLKVRVK